MSRLWTTKKTSTLDDINKAYNMSMAPYTLYSGILGSVVNAWGMQYLIKKHLPRDLSRRASDKRRNNKVGDKSNSWH